MAKRNRYAPIIDLIQAGRVGEATRICTRHYEEDGDSEALFYLGIIALRVGRFTDGAALLREADRLMPDRADIVYNLGVAMRHLGDLDGAIVQWTRAVKINAGHRDAWFNLARAYADTERFAEAEQAYRYILSANPGDTTTIYNLANTLYRTRQWAEAANLYRDVLTARPDFVDARINLGLALQRGGELDAAIREGRTAVEQAPDSALAHWNLSHCLLMTGRWAEGFSEFEWRRRLQVPPITISGQPEWTGFPLKGETVVVYGEQGHGDVLQFLRFAPLIAAAGGIAHVVCHPKLVRLAEKLDGVASSSAFGAPVPAFSYHVPLLSLPHALRLDSSDSLPQPPYLRAYRTPGVSERKVPSVGIAWRGNPEHADDTGRSCPLDTFARIFDVDGVDWVSLQFDGGWEEIKSMAPAVRVRDGTRDCVDFLDTAEVLASLDLVLSVDTAVVHLAGAMNIPTWVLLARAPDWRWQDRTNRSPWYPATTLFRQERDGDWVEVMDAVRSELRRYAFMP